MTQDPERQQARPPQVGDTLTVVHRIAVPHGTLVQARPPEDSTLATLTGPPDITREGDSVRIAYGLAVWSTGRHELVIPGAILVSPSGAVDTLPDARLSVDIASVLPAGALADTLQPQSARPWVTRADTSFLPLAVILVPMLVVLGAVAWWWRRRGPTRSKLPAPMVAPPDAARLSRWLDAGESALVIEHLLAALADLPDADAWRATVATVRFDTAQEDRLAPLAREGIALLPRRSATAP